MKKKEDSVKRIQKAWVQKKLKSEGQIILAEKRKEK